MTKKLSIKQLMEKTRKEQNDYLAILQDKGVHHPPRQLVKAETDRNVKKLVDNLKKNAPK